MSGPPPDIFEPDDDAALEKALDEAEAQIAAGQFISYEAIRRWLLSWGTDNELPLPKIGD